MKNCLTSRRSIRKYTDYKISDEEFNSILTDALRAPSSNNLQPIRLFVFKSDEAKEKLRPLLYGNVTQLETSSHMILITADTKKYEEAHKIFDKSVQLGLMPSEVRDINNERFKNIEVDPTDTLFLNSLHLDGGLFAMNLMQVARAYGYDTCAIGGFNKTNVIAELEIDPRYVPILIISIGKADESGYPSYRLDTKDVTTFL